MEPAAQGRPGARAGDPRWVRAAKRHSLGVEVVASVAAMTLVAWLVGASPEVLLLVGGASSVVRYWSGRAVVRPGLPRLEQVVRDTAVPFGAAAVLVAAGAWSRADLVGAAAVTVAGAAVAVAGAVARRVLPVRQRVVVVGSAVGVAEAATRWARSREVSVVGSLVVGDGLPGEPHPRTPLFGARIDLRREVDAAELTRADPDMVLVVPGPGIDAECIRRVGWALEGTRVSLAVQSHLDGIAPHRLAPTAYAGASLLHVASSRPARLPGAVKQAGDRVLGALLLALVAPLLGLLVLAVRRTSDGPGIFRQVRVGKDGSLFTMYKLRTMVTTAEADKAALMAANEGNGVLFKIAADPRVTPVGRLLRKFSLDELPQLVNVVKGEMSLVGPRPALPEEVAQYSSLERRRLAAKPGITGLWQVSGRSDLSWEDSVALDNHYTENWRLTDDAMILARTLNAVLGSKGAY